MHPLVTQQHIDDYARDGAVPVSYTHLTLPTSG